MVRTILQSITGHKVIGIKRLKRGGRSRRTQHLLHSFHVQVLYVTYYVPPTRPKVNTGDRRHPFLNYTWGPTTLIFSSPAFYSFGASMRILQVYVSFDIDPKKRDDRKWGITNDRGFHVYLVRGVVRVDGIVAWIERECLGEAPGYPWLSAVGHLRQQRRRLHFYVGLGETLVEHGWLGSRCWKHKRWRSFTCDILRYWSHVSRFLAKTVRNSKNVVDTCSFRFSGFDNTKHCLNDIEHANC